MSPNEPPRNRIALWFETTRRPSLVLACLILLLYGRSLGWGFVLDDWHHFQSLEMFHAGQRPSLELYRFLADDEQNRFARESGLLPWWVEDELRYQHWRPISEWFLYGQFLMFGRNPVGYHAVGLILYAIGIRFVLALFRGVSNNERLSRWGALTFTVLAGHAIPIVFISAQSDLVALVLSAASMAVGVQFLRCGGWRWILSAVCYALALGSKEACLALAVIPVCFLLMPGDMRFSIRRILSLSTVLTVIGLVWLGCYVGMGYGSNSVVMLNPISAPLDYISELPGRIVLLLSSLMIPVSPFIFYLRPRGEAWIVSYCIIGSAGWFLFARIQWRHYRRQSGTLSMALWILPFLPLLACTVPDDRVMVLPGIGFAFLVGTWLTGAHEDNRCGIRKVPFVLFILLQGFSAISASQLMRIVESDCATFTQSVAKEFDHDLRPGDCAFFLNVGRDWEVLFVQTHIEALEGIEGIRAAFLTDAEHVTIHRIDERTLRITANRDGFLKSYLGMLGSRRGRPRQEGDVFNAGELTGRILKVTNGIIREVEIRFKSPLESPRYRFFRCDSISGVHPWNPTPVGVTSEVHASDPSDPFERAASSTP
ncbi:MAG: hypothetical protein ACE5EQ_00445 [Phycisphaerae bacterium]